MSSPVSAKINIGQLLDDSRIGPLHIQVFALCMICLVMDGFDVQAMGYTAPAVLKEWNVPPGSQMGQVFAAANVGVLIGSLAFSMLADKIGRRPVLIGATVFFSLMTIATGYFASNMQELLILRAISGLGLGCIIPNATALIGEFSPKRSRVVLVMGITVGFTAGAAIGGFVAAWMIPAFGWRSVFYFGGAIPLAGAIAMIWGLPESLQFLAVRRTRLDQLARWLKRLNPTLRIDQTTEYVTNETGQGGIPIVHLFRDGRSAATILLWVVNFMNLLNLYSLSNWLPTVVTGMGYDQRTAVIVGAILQTGGTIGTYGLAWLIARKGFIPMLTATFALATLSIAFIGQPGITLTVLTIIVFVAGWCVIGGQPGINTLAATYYPTYLRSTGVGAGLGVGRVGAIIGPYIGGTLIGWQWGPQQLFWAAAVPAAISTLAMFALGLAMKSDAPAPTRSAAPLAH
ncbi:MAG TPA: aromatic acid/H+ symport family MFS transporter [Vicinamibacterales bacterium]|jgi:AAHS family 4-hydroxybenzoate transporter-like MFS transporter